jgi:hypothetical protein
MEQLQSIFLNVWGLLIVCAVVLVLLRALMSFLLQPIHSKLDALIAMQARSGPGVPLRAVSVQSTARPDEPPVAAPQDKF